MKSVAIATFFALVAAVVAVPPFDPNGAPHVGNGKGEQFITGQCLSDADCASGCCANPTGICSGPGAATQQGKTGCMSIIFSHTCTHDLPNLFQADSAEDPLLLLLLLQQHQRQRLVPTPPVVQLSTPPVPRTLVTAKARSSSVVNASPLPTVRAGAALVPRASARV